jgi:hypothetical protein
MKRMLLTARVLVAIGPCALSIPLQGASSPAGVEVVTTDRVDFGAGGTIRFAGSSGELNIQGWDQPQVEITVTRSAWCDDTPQAREKTTRELNLISVTHEKKSDGELVVSTTHRRSFSIHLDYRIMVPHNSRLMVEHRMGDVVIKDVDGAIDAHAHFGDILVMLPSTSRYSFDAACGIGGIHSDFAGTWHRNHLTGERFSQDAPAPAPRIRLRAGTGGIEIQKTGPYGVASTT